MTLKNLGTKNNFDIEFQDNFLKDDSSLAIRSFKGRLIKFAAYEFRGKIFAYRAFFARVLESPDGTTTIGGILSQVIYFDEDGDGVFEALYPIKDSVDFIPGWAK